MAIMTWFSRLLQKLFLKEEISTKDKVKNL